MKTPQIKPKLKAKMKPTKKTAKAKAEKPKATGTQCITCRHPKVGEINSKILAGESFREIARFAFGNELETQHNRIFRHTHNCLATSVGAVMQKKQGKQGIDVLKEFEEQLSFAKKLRNSAEEYLSDPVDPLKLKINPFAHEVSVTYFDYTDMTEGENSQPKKKTAPLNSLLVNVETLRNVEVDKVSVKHVDLRSFALDSIKTADVCIDRFARISGIYQKDRENAEYAKKTAAAIHAFLEQHPDADRDAVIDQFTRGRGLEQSAVMEHLGTIG